MQQSHNAVFIEGDDTVPRLRADHLAHLCPDVRSWFNFLKMAAGGPPAAMTACDTDSGQRKRMLVLTDYRRPDGCDSFRDATLL